MPTLRTGPQRIRYPLVLSRPDDTDDRLNTLALLTSTGFVSRTTTGWASRTLQQPDSGISITNADGVAGNPVFSLRNDLAALEALQGVGYARRTGNDTWTLTPGFSAADIAWAAAATNSVFAGPAAGPAGAPTFRMLGAADLPQATESAKGAAEIATQAEVDAGTDDTRAVTTLKLKTYADANYDAIGAAAAALVAANGYTDTQISGLSAVYQPLDLDLTEIAALTTQAFGRSLLTAVDAIAARDLIELGTTDIPQFTRLRLWDSVETPPAWDPVVKHLVQGDGAVFAGFVSMSNTAGLGPTFLVGRGRGTWAVPTSIQNGDVLGSFEFRGFLDTTTNGVGESSARYQVNSTEAWTSTTKGTTHRWSSTLTGTVTIVEVMRMSGAGNLLVGMTLDGPATGSGNIRLSNKLWLGDDANLYRSSANLLKTDDTFESAALSVLGQTTIQKDNAGYTFGQLVIQSVTNTNNRVWLGYDTAGNTGVLQAYQQTVGARDFLLQPNGGRLLIGNPDTNLYRGGANVLVTDDLFVAAGGLRSGGSLTNLHEDVNAVTGLLIRGAEGMIQVGANDSGTSAATILLTNATTAILNRNWRCNFRPTDGILGWGYYTTTAGGDGFPGWKPMIAFGTDGKLLFGDTAGTISTVPDVNLYRGGADILKTDDAFEALTVSTSFVEVEVAADDSISATITNDTATQSANLLLRRARTGGVVSVGDRIGQIVFRGYAGTTYGNAAFVRAEVESVYADSANGINGKLLLMTCVNGVQTSFFQSSAGNALVPNTLLFGTAGDTNLYRSAANRLQTDDDFWAVSVRSPTLQSFRTSSGDNLDARMFNATATTSASITLRRAYGTEAAPTAVQIGARIGVIAWGPYGTTGYPVVSASIIALATENASDTAAGTELRFGTTPNGTIARADRLWIAENGNIGIGLTPDTSTKLDVVQTGGVSGTVTAALLRAGNVAAYFGNNQICFGYNAGATYRHAIKTRHSSGASASNCIDFYIWRNGQLLTDVGDKQVVTMTGEGRVGIATNTPAEALHVSGNAQIDGAVRIRQYTVATLPAVASWTGGFAVVTDATQTLADGGTAVTGGGANIIPVFSNGSQWIVV